MTSIVQCSRANLSKFRHEVEKLGAPYVQAKWKTFPCAQLKYLYVVLVIGPLSKDSRPPIIGFQTIDSRRNPDTLFTPDTRAFIL